MDWTKTTAKWDEKYLSFGFGPPYIRSLIVINICVYCSGYTTSVTWTALIGTYQIKFTTSGLDIKASPHALGMWFLCQGTKTFVVTCPTGPVIFLVRACTYPGVLIFPTVYISFTGLVKTLAAHAKFLAGHVNFQNHVPDGQGWGEYYSGTRLAQNDKHEYTKNTVLEYYSSTDFPVLVLVCSVLAPALPMGM